MLKFVRLTRELSVIISTI